MNMLFTYPQKWKRGTSLVPSHSVGCACYQMLRLRCRNWMYSQYAWIPVIANSEDFAIRWPTLCVCTTLCVFPTRGYAVRTNHQNINTCRHHFEHSLPKVKSRLSLKDYSPSLHHKRGILLNILTFAVSRWHFFVYRMTKGIWWIVRASRYEGKGQGTFSLLL